MVMMEEANSAMDGHHLLVAIASGKLAAQIAQQASLQREKGSLMVNEPEPLTDDDDDEEEEMMNMFDLRRRTKLISDVAAASNCLPAHLVQEKEQKAPLASIAVLQTAIDTLQDIVSQPSKHGSHAGASMKSLPESTTSQAESPKAALQADAPVEAKPPMRTSPTDDVLPLGEIPAPVSPAKRPTLAKTATARPTRRKTSRTGTTGKNRLVETESPPSTPVTSPGKPPKPANDSPSVPFKFALKPQKTMRPASCFHMDASGDERNSDMASLVVRDSSLARTYDSLGVQHCSLDDGSDVETRDSMQDTMSLVSSYEALGTRFPSRASRPLSPAGRLPPVKPLRRASVAAPEPPRSHTPSGPSAMELDLGLCGSSSCYSTLDRERTPTPAQQKRSPCVGSLPVLKTSSKQSGSLTLPALPGAKVASTSLGSKVVPKMRTGSVGARPWGASPASNFIEWDTRRLVF